MQQNAQLFLKAPGIDSREFRHLRLVMTMFEGDMPVKVRMADTGKLFGATCQNHPAFLQECEQWLGKEKVVLRVKES